VARTYTVVGEVELFEREGGWHFLRVPTRISDDLQHLADRGLIAIRATVGDTSWDTSLLPLGDGTTFVPLNAKVRTRNDLTPGNTVTLSFTPR
jgi:hypothetical protein